MRIFHPMKAFHDKQDQPEIQGTPAQAVLADPLPLHSIYLTWLLKNARIYANAEKPVILCIGTDRIIGDSLGPLTGSLLEKYDGASFFVYGTLSSTVHACNLEKTLRQIKKEHPGSVIIAVDASLGQKNKIGSVFVHPGSLKPGMGVSKDLPATGDISITGIAGARGDQPYLTLQTVRLSLIMEMAEQICACIVEACG